MKKLLGAALVIGAAIYFWPRTQHDENLLYDRLWVDHLPRTETDRFELFAALTEQPIGVFQASSVWQGEWELFRHEGAGDGRILIMYPQTGKKERAAYRARKCSERGFDFCLELDATHGAKRYYSQKGWELRGARTVDDVRGAVARTKVARAAR